MQNRSICFLTNAYPDFESSYRGIFIKKMVDLLHNQGYEICVVTPKIYKESPCFEKKEGIKVYRFPFFSGNKLLIEYEKVPYLRMILYYLTGFFFLIYAVLKHRCRLIHTHWAIPTGLIGVWVKYLLKRPLIVTVHGSDLRMALERAGILRKLFLFVCKNANHLNCVSNVQKREMEQLGIKSEKISVIPMGVDESFLENGKGREIELSRGSVIIFSNRNLLPIYNVSLLVRAIPHVLKEEPKAKFFIAGDGPEKENLEIEVKRLNVSSSVRFLGRVPHQEMPNLLAQSDIYVSTSLYDGTSVSLLEAMACGTFPIVTDILSNREWIYDGENGFLTSTEDKVALATKIISAIRNRELLMSAKEKNLKIIKDKAYLKNNTRKITEIYEHFFH